MTAEREGLTEIAAALHRERHQGLPCGDPECWELDKATEHADALADLLAARDRRVRAEALREAGDAAVTARSHSERWWEQRAWRSWLCARANQIEADR